MNIPALVAAQTVMEKGKKKGNPIDSCAEARRTLRLYENDVKAGHTDAARYWQGQSEAFGLVCLAQNPRAENNPNKEGIMAEGKCDPEDIICRAELLGKMRNLRGAFDDPKFREKYPSLVELAPKLDDAIKAEEASLGADLGACELPTPREPGKEEDNE